MNLGFYSKSLTNEEEIKFSIENIEKAFNDNAIDDASIFFDSNGFSPFFFPCGLFNATELWSFSGKLVVFDLDSLRSAIKVVNDIDIYYIFGWEKVSPINMLVTLSNNNVKAIGKTEKDSQEFYRLTGTNTIGTVEDNNILNILGA